MDRRVVVTGIGAITSIGTGCDEFWQALLSGKSGISEVESFDTATFPTHRGGEVKNFDPSRFVSQRKAKILGRSSLFAIAAAKLALRDTRLSPGDIREHAGVCLGTTMGEAKIFEVLNEAWIHDTLDDAKSSLIPRIPPNVIPGHIAAEFGLRGPNYIIPTACAAGNYAIGYAYDLIKSGDIDMMFAGGADAFSRIAFCGFNRLLSVAPQICQPFDRDRKGMLVGEGAGILILESLESAERRKASMYAEIIGYGLSCDATHMTTPSHEGIKNAMVNALSQAHISASQVDYLNAHGTGTAANDREECRAIKEVFGQDYKRVAVSSIKSMLGHAMGAASALEAIACCCAVKNDIIPPTINFKVPDPDCDIDCVPNIARKKKVSIALNNAFAFGGNNSCLVLKKFIP